MNESRGDREGKMYCGHWQCSNDLEKKNFKGALRLRPVKISWEYNTGGEDEKNRILVSQKQIIGA